MGAPGPRALREHGDVLLSGGDGFLADRLVRALVPGGYGVRWHAPRAKGRASGLPDSLRPEVTPLSGDAGQLTPAALEGATALVHLADAPLLASVAARLGSRAWGQRQRDTTRSLVDVLGALPDSRRPSVFLCASSVGYYGDRGEELLDEDAGPGEGLVAELWRDCEAQAARAEQLGVRTLRLRIGVVMAREAGALPRALARRAWGLGGALGEGQQWVPWIHANDLARLVWRLLREQAIRGPVNAVAPGAVRNAELAAGVAAQLGRRPAARLPAFALRWAHGPLASESLASRLVVPARAQALGFDYAHPGLASALAMELVHG